MTSTHNANPSERQGIVKGIFPFGVKLIRQLFTVRPAKAPLIEGALLLPYLLPKRPTTGLTGPRKALLEPYDQAQATVRRSP